MEASWAFLIPSVGQAASDANSWLVSAGAHFGFGFLILFYGVQKFFEEIEKKLNADTKREIAVWLLDLPPGKTIQSWHTTFPKLFNRVFGDRHLSWKCFWRSCAFTAVVTALVMVGREFLQPPRDFIREINSLLLAFSTGVFGGSLLPDYFSLWKTRYLMNLSRTTKSSFLNLLFLLVDIIATFVLAICSAFIGLTLLVFVAVSIHYHAVPVWAGTLGVADIIERVWSSFLTIHEAQPMFWGGLFTIWFIPAFFGRLWLLTYVGSGLLLKAARRFDIGFAWFNRRFDVQDHPLQCIGLVAGALLALGYWVLAGIRLLP